MRRRCSILLFEVAISSTGFAFCQTISSPTSQTQALPSPLHPPPEARLGFHASAPLSFRDLDATGTTPLSRPTVSARESSVDLLEPVAEEKQRQLSYGSTYIPMDSWIYPAVTRFYSLGFADTLFLGMRPYTRQSLLHSMQASEAAVRDSDNEEAQGIYTAVMKELRLENPNDGVGKRGAVYGTESVYGRALGISGQTLRDSYHLGQTLVNDYGRPYEPGFNSLVGASTVAEYGRFSLYIRGEYQHSPPGSGYSLALASYLSVAVDAIPYSGPNLNQATIPQGAIAAENPFRLMEATVSFHLLGNEISGGKSDAWLGPAQGGALAWSNNAENIYSFRINRVEPLHVPLLSRLLGPFRYDFMYGSLKGHTYPNNDWVDSFMISARPSSNFEFGFQRTIIFGGKGHQPVTLHTFLKGFFSVSDTTGEEKYSRSDPGARFSDFNMSYRLPFLRKHVTFYVDSIVHDDVTPPSAPRRASFRTGLFLSQIPKVPKMDLRFEAMDMDPITARSSLGNFNYYETIQRQAYTNKGFILGDWAGREAKGGQVFLTYHLSGKEWVQLLVTNKKNDKDFSPGAPNANAYLGFNPTGGTTQNQVKVSVVKRFHHDDVELNGWFQYEKWNVPSYMYGPHSDTTTAVQITFFPGMKSTVTK